MRDDIAEQLDALRDLPKPPWKKPTFREEPRPRDYDIPDDEPEPNGHDVELEPDDDVPLPLRFSENALAYLFTELWAKLGDGGVSEAAYRGG